MKQKTAIERPSPGRPREFDREEALQTAVRLFSQHGYEGVSIADLTQAMNISPPSLYAAFGSKEALYREALAAYQRHKTQLYNNTAGTIRQRVEAMLRDAVLAVTEPGYPAGCMVVAGMLNCSAENQSLASTLTDLRNGQRQSIADHLHQALANGELPPQTDVDALSRYLTAVFQGLAIQARDGATQAELYALVEIAMCRFPAPPETEDSCSPDAGK